MRMTSSCVLEGEVVEFVLEMKVVGMMTAHAKPLIDFVKAVVHWIYGLLVNVCRSFAAFLTHGVRVQLPEQHLLEYRHVVWIPLHLSVV